MNMTASNAGLWVNCSGSVLMQTLIPAEPGDEESEAAREGKAFHAVSASVLKSMQDPNTSMPKLLNTLAPNGVVIDEQMTQAITDYVTNIMQYAHDNSVPLSTFDIEKRIDTPMLGNDKYSIPDVCVINESTGELFLCDGKYGHRFVDVFENWQLLIYALSKAYEMPDTIKSIRMRLYQPRSYHYEGPCRDWVINIDELHTYGITIIEAVEKVRGDDPQCTPGPWCRASRCSGAHGCTSLQSSCYNHIDHVSNLIPCVLDEASAATEYLILDEAEKLIATRRKAIEAQCKSMIKSGSRLPGLGVEQGYGRERWRKDTPTDEVIMMGDLLGVDVRKPREIDTPAKCRKLGIDDSVIKAYSETPKTDLKLVKDDGRKARQVFR